MGFIREVRNDIEREALRLMRGYYSMLLAEAKRLCGDDQTAEDLAMKAVETYLAKPEDELPSEDKTGAWLRAAVRNHYQNSIRGKARACTVYVDQTDAERLAELGPVDNSTDEAILAHSDAELVRSAIARLPPDVRSIIMLRYFESLPIRQIAEIIRRSPDSVRSNLYYARKVLAKRLGKMMGRAALAIAAVLFGGSLVYAAAVAVGLAPSLFTAAEPAAEAAPEESTEVSEGSLTGLSANQESQTTGADGDSPQVVAEVTDNFNTNKEENAVNGSIVKKSAAKLVAAAAVLCGASAALAASTNEFAVIDIMETVRQSEVESPFTFSTTGENDGSHSEQLFDGDLTADNTKSSDQNGRAIFTISKGPSITVSFNPAVFGNRQLYLQQYGFRMWHRISAPSWNIANRMPGTWTVHVSGVETPSSEDDWTLVDSRERPIAYSDVATSYYSADFTTEALVPTRHVRFTFTQGNGANDYVSLGEITMSGLLGPDDEDARDVALYRTGVKSVNGDGSVDAIVSILPAGQTVDPFDLFVECRTGDHADTNWLARATTLTGLYETKVTGLRLGAGYTLRFGAVSANGAVSVGDAVNFASTDDLIPGRLPAGYTELEYIESTDAGHQYIDCGFVPNGIIIGFDLDFIGYNAFMRGAYHDTDNRETGYGVYLSSIVKGQNAQVLVSSSTGGQGGYPDGLFVYGGGAMNARLTRGERMSVLLGNGKYTTICGAVTNAQNKTRGAITGPTLSLFASENGPGNDPDQFAVMRLYSLKVYDDTSTRTLTHEFVPAKRQSDNVIGVYDVVANAWCPNGSATPFLAGPKVGGADLTIDSVSYVGRTLTVTLRRDVESTAEADVYAAWGADYAAMDTAGWEHTARLGAFAENAQTAQFTTPALARDTVYVRFYTDDGKWSETVYLPDQPAKSSGFIYIVR